MKGIDHGMLAYSLHVTAQQMPDDLEAHFGALGLRALREEARLRQWEEVSGGIPWLNSELTDRARADAQHLLHFEPSPAVPDVAVRWFLRALLTVHESAARVGLVWSLGRTPRGEVDENNPLVLRGRIGVLQDHLNMITSQLGVPKNSTESLYDFLTGIRKRLDAQKSGEGA